jgi:hypothetical protein
VKEQGPCKGDADKYAGVESNDDDTKSADNSFSIEEVTLKKGGS